MATKENNLPILYGELNKLGQNGEYERAIKVANKSEFPQVCDFPFNCKSLLST